MLKNLSVEELHEMINKRQEKASNLRDLVKKQEIEIGILKQEIDSRKNWQRHQVIDEMIEMVQDRSGEISVSALNSIISELNNVKNPRGYGSTRKYSYSNQITRMYFDLGYLIRKEIREIRPNHKFQYSSYTIRFDFDNNKEEISRNISSTVFDRFKGKAINNENILCFEKENISILKKALSSKLPTRYKHYKEAISTLIDFVKYIEQDFSSVIVGCHLSQITKGCL